ncbi:MurR/RpiR family transcriptional regulator [Microlunatus soli]|uniref:MurR/RpiR family transcriptional regulator n=1 Tax=Microlunatus soli TaxID=630515 RepID=UPI00155F84C8|nr:MurR/RpiR family transcriptional regulator [Microlunatus soli]
MSTTADPIDAAGAGRSTAADVTARITSLLPSLLPAEQQVARVLLDRAGDAADLSSQQVAELAGTSRATVVRASQSLGFSGYQQLRVLLARDAALADRARSARTPERGADGLATSTYRRFEQVRDAADRMTALLDPEQIESAVRRLAAADRILVVGHGLSRSLAIDAAARLVRLGLVAEHLTDRIDQLIVTRLLGERGVVLMISGSGSHTDSIGVAREVRQSAAHLIAVTAFARSPIAELADTLLVVGMPNSSFTEELTDTTRIPQAILLEGLMASLRDHLGERGHQAAALALAAVSDHVQE